MLEVVDSPRYVMIRNPSVKYLYDVIFIESKKSSKLIESQMTFDGAVALVEDLNILLEDGVAN